MSRYHSYINTAKEVLNVYNGSEPFSSFLKKYFSANKKFGSRDRKQISNLCYCYFRLGKAITSLAIEQRILIGLFLCSNEANEILASLKPEWNEKVLLPIEEKLLIINYSLLSTEIFPYEKELSAGIEHEKFCKSFLMQPDLFIRLRPGKEKVVVEKLKQSKIDFKKLSATCFALPNTSKLEDVIDLDKEVVIQDCNSQETGKFIKSEISIPIAIGIKSQIKVWDCCAASGGKSIMTYDIDPTIDLTVSDVRDSILINLKKRFEKAGIRNYKAKTIDLSKEGNIQQSILNNQYSIVIGDVPCTGSGTWSRSPEQLYFFKEEKIGEYADLQKKIVSNVIPHLQPGGSFIYITCSVFKKENEEVVEFIKQNFHLQLKQMEVLKGYDKKADSMFVAVLSLPKHEKL